MAEDDAPDETSHLLPPKPTPQKPQNQFQSAVQGLESSDIETGSIHSIYSHLSSQLSKEERDLALTSVGERLPYSDYTTIDWLHELVKDSVQLRLLRSRHGLRARAWQAWDGASGWVAVALMGTLTACVAFLVDLAAATVTDWKTGYCAAGWWNSKETCCTRKSPLVNGAAIALNPWYPRGQGSVRPLGKHEAGEVCSDWVYWSEDYVHSFAIYVGFALAFGIISGAVTLLTKKNLPAAAPGKGDTNPTSLHFDETEVTEAVANHTPEVANGGYGTASRKGEGPAKGKTMYMAAGSGIPEIKTILSGFVIPNFLDLKVLIVKAVGSVFAVSTGMCLGKEGPFVHISTCVAYLVSGWMPKYSENGRKLREMLSAGCASGLSVAFGAPIGGVLFSYEEISTFFPRKVLWRAFLCSLFAAIVLKHLNPNGTGKLVLFETNYGTSYAPHHYLIFIVLGIAGGIFGGTFCKLNFLWSKSFRGFSIIKNHPVFEVALVTAATALLQYPNAATRESGDVIIKNLLVDCRKAESASAWVCVHERGGEGIQLEYIGWLAYGTVVKLILTTVTFGIKVPSGIIIPALDAGAFFGRLVGQFVSSGGAESISPGIFAMVGAVAFLAGVCRMTISLAVIMFELTGELEYVVPYMIGILVAKWVADALEPEGVYDLAQTVLGHPFLDGDAALKIAQRKGALVDDLIPPEQTMREITVEVPQSGLVEAKVLAERLAMLKRRGLMDAGLILVRNRMPLGYLGETELDTGLSDLSEQNPSRSFIRLFDEHGLTGSELDLAPFVDRTPLTVHRSAPIEFAVEMFSKLGPRYLCVVEEATGQLCGVVIKKRLLDWLHKNQQS